VLSDLVISEAGAIGGALVLDIPFRGLRPKVVRHGALYRFWDAFVQVVNVSLIAYQIAHKKTAASGRQTRTGKGRHSISVLNSKE
jgi:hypothetical protein